MRERLLIISVIILLSSILIVILQSSIFIVSKFDYLKLVEQWPASTCNNLTYNTCLLPLPNNFTIHGLWPEIFKEPTPKNCTKTPFDLSKITALEPQLNQYWPNLIKPRENSAFWEHEWRTHGTCSESTFDLPAYFNLTLKLKGRLNLDKVLQDANITPGRNYTNLEIFNAIKNKTKVDPILRCNNPYKNKTSQETQNSQLWEVVVCYKYDKKEGINKIDCPPPFGKPTAICKDRIDFPIS